MVFYLYIMDIFMPLFIGLQMHWNRMIYWQPNALEQNDTEDIINMNAATGLTAYYIFMHVIIRFPLPSVWEWPEMLYHVVYLYKIN